jgi:hypothetical protein
MGLSVTGTYAMLAFGLFRTVAFISVASRGVMLFAIAAFVHFSGLQGLATARVCYGLLALLVYIPLFNRLKTHNLVSPLTGVYQLPEVSKS